jgi:RNA polymerase sigma-70 factor (ECF subfamily)
MPPSPQQVTQILLDWNDGDENALDRLLPIVHDELHRQAARYLRRERQGHTLQPTALINEAYLRLVDQKRVRWQNRAHFFGVAAQMMRRVLVDHARGRHRLKRGCAPIMLPLEEAAGAKAGRGIDLVALNESLAQLSRLDEQQGRIVELRYFAGLSNEETAEVVGISIATVKRDWSMAKAWLRRELGKERDSS